MNFKDRLKRKAIKTKDPSTWNQFRKTKNRVNKTVIKSAKKAYYKIAFNSCAKDQRKTLKAINDLTSSKSNKTVINERKYQGQKSESLAGVAEFLNTFFISSHVCVKMSFQKLVELIKVFELPIID